MKKHFRQLPLYIKLMLIAIFPLLYAIFLTHQLIKEKTDNIHLFQSYQEQATSAQRVLNLISDLQEELKSSYTYTLNKSDLHTLTKQRIQTDREIQLIKRSTDSLLHNFDRYTFLTVLPIIRTQIDNRLITHESLTSYYLKSISRLSSLDYITVPSNHHLQHVQRAMNEQAILSQMITNLAIIRFDIYAKLYTPTDSQGVLLNLKNTYDVYESYRTELFTNGSKKTQNAYMDLEQHSDLKAIIIYLNFLFQNKKLNSEISADNWWNQSGKALDELKILQATLQRQVTADLNIFNQNEHAAKNRTILLLVITLIFIAVLILYIMLVMNGMLNELKRAAQKISQGYIGITLQQYSHDVIGSLAQSIITIDEMNQKVAHEASAIGKGDFSTSFAPRSSEDILGKALVKMKEELLRFTFEQKRQQQIISKAVLSAQEKERSNLGAELHDNVNQLLTSVKLYLELIQTEEVKQKELLIKSKTNLLLAMEEIRKLSRELVVPKLESFDLKHALDVLAHDLLSSSGINYQLVVFIPESGILSEEFKIILYRIMQEQLTNIVKYAEASFVFISIEIKKDILELTISDDGKGFDPLKRKKGIGLTNITNRARVFNGTDHIESTPGEGCKLKVIFNLKEVQKLTFEY